MDNTFNLHSAEKPATVTDAMFVPPSASLVEDVVVSDIQAYGEVYSLEAPTYSTSAHEADAKTAQQLASLFRKASQKQL